ncbi:hypothetical protein ACQP06_22190 [Nocardia sp. CA-136227]|uniref:hypothetical protein n=1 Tax=Nocardia sp. CA-136227 TaxID=3239979 RepID=UPI003D983EE3
MKQKFLMAAAVPIAALGMTMLPATASAGPGTFEGDVIGCPYDRPCITELWARDGVIHVAWKGDHGYDVYNFRWGRPGRAESQYERGSGRYGSTTINNGHSNTTYTVKVQGCTTHWYGSSDCSQWNEAHIHIG